MRVGQGFDVHALVSGRKLMLGGVHVPFEKGLEGHSDGDVLLHAISDAILGALGEGDLGRHFPSSDERYRGIASGLILEEVAGMMRGAGWRIGNVDATVIAEAPRLASFQAEMKSNIVRWLETSPEAVNIKVTSTDHLGFVGRGDGIAGMATVLIERQSDA